MIYGKDNNASQDNRGLFVRFLNPIWQGVTHRASLHNGILGAINKQLEEVQSDIVASAVESHLKTATGTFLDHWGNFIGVSRVEGEDDSKYRARIEKYIIVLRATIPSIKDALYDFLGDHGANIHIYEPFRDIFYTNKSMLNGKDHLQGDYYRYAVIDISIDRPFDYDKIMEQLNKFKPAGVLIHITYNPSLNSNFGILTGLHDNLEARRVLTESQFLSGYVSNSPQEMLLATQELSNDHTIFRTNRSLINSTDVLAGSPTQNGKPSVHEVFTTSDEVVVGNTDSVIQIASQGVPCSSDMYTTTGHQGGAKAEVDLELTDKIYFAYDLLEYYMHTNKELYITKKIKYIKIVLADSSRGMDLGYLTAMSVDGRDVASDAKWSVSVEGKKPFDTYDNGENLVNQTDRRTYATLQLTTPTVLSSIKVENSYNGSVVGGIYVSEDGEDYHNVYYGTFSDREYPLIDMSSLAGVVGGETTYGEFLNGIYSDAKIHVYLDSGARGVTHTLEIFNFRSGLWEVLDSKVSKVSPYTKLQSDTTGSMYNFISDSGVVMTRLTPNTEGRVVIDYVGVLMTNNHGFRYSLKYPISIRKPEVAEEPPHGLLINKVVQDTILPSMGLGELGGSAEEGYKKPLRTIRVPIELKDKGDPNKGKYFKTSKGATPETSTDYGFGAGKLADIKNIQGAKAVVKLTRRGALPTVTFEQPLSGSNLIIDFQGWDYNIKSVEVNLFGADISGTKVYGMDYLTGTEVVIGTTTQWTRLFISNVLTECSYKYQGRKETTYPTPQSYLYTRSITQSRGNRVTDNSGVIVESSVLQEPIK